MFGIGKLVGKLVGGVLESVGLGSIAPMRPISVNSSRDIDSVSRIVVAAFVICQRFYDLICE